MARARGSGSSAAPTAAAVNHAAARPVELASPARPASALRRLPRTSMYTRVVVLNAAILVVATALLALTPATVSFPVAIDQALILAGGLVLLVVMNAVLLRFSFRGLEALVKRMETLDVLRPRERLPAMGGIETRALIDGFNTMLTRVEDERRRSARIAFSALEGERRRVGQELHDEIGQRLTGILLQLGRIADDTALELHPRLVAVQEEVRATLDEVGGLAWQLRPGILDDLGLLSALEALVQTLGDRSETRIELSLPSELDRLAPEVELAVYRVAQESLHNALRHAGARNVRVSLRTGDRALELEVVDDGCGFRGMETEGPGLRGMRERALLIGARLRIDSPFGHGVRVRLDVPRER